MSYYNGAAAVKESFILYLDCWQLVWPLPNVEGNYQKRKRDDEGKHPGTGLTETTGLCLLLCFLCADFSTKGLSWQFLWRIWEIKFKHFDFIFQTIKAKCSMHTLTQMTELTRVHDSRWECTWNAEWLHLLLVTLAAAGQPLSGWNLGKVCQGGAAGHSRGPGGNIS